MGDRAIIRPRRRRIISIWCAICLCLLVVGVWADRQHGSAANGDFWGSGVGMLPPVRREAVTPEFDEVLIGGDQEIKKVYGLRDNHWYLSAKLTDFSQAVDTTRVFYIANGADSRTYSVYRIGNDGTMELSSTATAYESDAELPIGFMGLTYEIIERDIGDLPCDDYVVTYSARLYTVFVWVRSAEGDHIVAYPSRPEFVNLETHGVYTLNGLQAALAETYENDR